MSEYPEERPATMTNWMQLFLFLLSKISSATMIIVAFYQAVYGDGLGAIEFWLSLFYAAALQQPAADKSGTQDRNRDEIRYRQIM